MKMTAETAQNVITKDKEQIRKKDDKSREKKDKELPPTKVVIRRLPPSLTAETFIEQISPVPDHNYFYFAPAEDELLTAGFSRAYINFVNEDDVFIFTEKFDNYVFIDGKGNEYPAIVEYAPFQKVPKNKPKKPDSRKGTIENDTDYIKFLEQLQNPSTGDHVFTPETLLEEIENKEKELKGPNRSTPLLDYIRKKKEEKKQANFKLREERKKREEERRRKRDEERKKKRDRDRERQREKERQRQRDKERERERELRQKEREKQKAKTGDSSQPLKLLTKQEKEEGYDKSGNKRSDGENSETMDRKYEGARPKTTDRGKDRNNDSKEPDPERRERDRRRREKEDEEERRWQERERERRERREKERKEREKRERDRREKEKVRRDKERRQRERDREQERKTEDSATASETTNLVSVLEKSSVKDVMVESTSSIEEQPSSSNEASDKPRDKQRQRARYKDRPERQIYNPGQRAAERRKQMEARSSGKESTPDSVKDGSEKTDSNNSSRRNSVGSSHSPRDN